MKMFFNCTDKITELDTEAVFDALEVARLELIKQRNSAETGYRKAETSVAKQHYKDMVLNRFDRLNRICKVQQLLEQFRSLT